MKPAIENKELIIEFYGKSKDESQDKIFKQEIFQIENVEKSIDNSLNDKIVKDLYSCYCLLEKSKKLSKDQILLNNEFKKDKIIKQEFRDQYPKQIKIYKDQSSVNEECDKLYNEFKIERINKSSSKIALEILINQLLTIFYKQPEFKDKMPYEITSELADLIRNSDFNKQNPNFIKLIMDIANNVQANFVKNETHEKRIKEYLQKDFGYEEDEIIIKPTGLGKNSSFIVNTPNGKKFVKVCGYNLVGLSTIDGKIHPNELFLYKTLEYLNFGPKTNFLMHNRASGSLTTNSPTVIAHGNYIMTDEVPNFFLYTNEQDKEKINTNHYMEFKNSNNKEDAVELSSAALLKDLLSISDVYPNNGENYGISKIDNKTKFMFIDHIPGTNGVFSGENLEKDKIDQYSPREYIRSSDYSNLNDLSESYKKWQKFTLAKEVNKRIFEGGENSKDIICAVNHAKKDIEGLIDKYPDNFAEFTTESGNEIDSKTKLQGYVNKITKNIENYKQTKYAKIGGLEK